MKTMNLKGMLIHFPGQLVNIRGKSIGKWPSETLEFYSRSNDMDLRIIEHLVQLVWELRLVVYYLVKKNGRSVRNKITTIQKLKVIQIDLEENILVIKDLFQENLVTY
jgi:hypothetical protein